VIRIYSGGKLMPKKKESFEEMMKRLDEISNVMDNEQLSLDQSMKYYEEGIKLCNKLYKDLNEAEGKVKILMEGKEEPFSLNEE
jgi:exodeoxyribonuclease VII small subunit